MTEHPTPNPQKNRRPHPLEAPPRQPINPEDYRGQRATLHIPVVRPYVVWTLIAVNSLIYAVVYFLLDDLQVWNVYQASSSNKIQVLANGEYHRLITSMFLHSYTQPFHIVFNMYALYIIGVNVERFFGHMRFIIIYVLGGLAGSLLSVLLNPVNTYSVGASGAVFAIFAAQIVFLYNHRKLFGSVGQAQLRHAVVIAVLNLGFGILTAFNQHAEVSIDNWGHIGGLLGGLALAWFISPNFIPEFHAEQQDTLTVRDINPLENRVQPILAYISVLLALLVGGILLT
jgi:rhomboid protease GluP